MKRKGVLALAAVFMLAVSACDSKLTVTPASAEEIMAGINTAVALTNMPPQSKMADSNISVQSAALAPSSTPVIAATMTLFQQPTLVTQVLYSDGEVCDSAAYIDDVTIPDGTVFAPGATFTKKWRMKNTGTCAWTTGYAMTFSSGDSMSGATTVIDETVAPDASANISVELNAPTTEGTYTGYWILANSSGTAFGNIVYVKIVVSSSVATSTPTPTTETIATTEATATPVPTFTSTPTVEPTIEPTTIATEAPIAPSGT